MRPFFIGEIPDTADYYLPPVLLKRNRDDLQRLTDKIQVVDPRFSDFNPQPTQSIQYAPSIFDIVDRIESHSVAPVLCSTSIFKSYHRGRHEESWKGYIKELQDKIAYFATTPYQQLRVYASNSMWQDLDDAGVLKSQNVEFVKMRDSSTGWNIGNMWRILALTDYRYDYVYFDDVHVSAPQRRHAVTFERFQGLFANTDAVIASLLVAPPTQYHTFLTVLPPDFFFDISDHFYQPIVQIIPIDAFLKTMIFDWYRGPQKLPPMDLPYILLSCLNQHPLTQVYDPELNGWTYLQPVAQMYQDVDSAEKIMFYLSKLVKLKLWFYGANLSWYLEGYKKSGDDFFWKRMIGDVNCELTFGDRQQVFAWSELENYVVYHN